MICYRCHHFAAAAGGTLCAQCAAAPAPTAPPVAAVPGAFLRSPVGLGRATAVLLGLVVVADLFAIGADVVMYDVSGDLVDGAVGDAVSRRADRADALYSAAGIAQTAAMLACMVVFLCWFYRVRVNAEVFEPYGHQKRRGWAIGGWFTPVVNLWFPRRITLDIWDASGPSGARRSHGLVNAWWAMWIVSILAERSGFSAYRRADTAQELYSAVPQVIFADVTDMAAALLAILVVLRLTRMQHEKALQGAVPPSVAV
ncbi:DUF4328 domain-containing protein [Streptomyces gibsoniae]|uniref:DUF4328 domain-containing protein n=1 Tax=Streptomyces gibsoniae TaxID=3075529 RepID=A0ABU2TYU5_9ACTN|nr:DUF4328 domain-containing protein [Streptomyces sp. DSM 41699]MDT0466144.1 DUF4328 domain-containing protein [Streptomyces sp. DSM 41699]